MKKRSIELELRGEITQTEIPKLTAGLKKLRFKESDVQRRTSLMCFGILSVKKGLPVQPNANDHVDVRCRVTNGKAEVVAKMGTSFAAHDRLEIAVPTSLPDMLRFAQLFGSMGFFSKVGSKTTFDYAKGPIVISIVQSRSGLAYVEIEKMTDTEHLSEDRATLHTLASNLGVDLWKTDKQFYNFCDKLTAQDDWIFHGTNADVARLQKEIQLTGSGKKSR